MKLLVAVDGSLGSLKAVQRAAELAKEAIAHEVVIIHVMESSDAHSFLPPSEAGEKEERAKKVLEDMKQVAVTSGIETTTALLRGHPVQAVLDYAEVFKPDMILVGSKGTGGSRTSKIGSVAAAIGNRAKHPVLIVHAD